MVSIATKALFSISYFAWKQGGEKNKYIL